jgi:hypothetical protein
MRWSELYERRGPQLSDTDRARLIKFLVHWLSGYYMSGNVDTTKQWEEFASLFPHRVARPLRLFRMVTLPIRYADKIEFDLARPAPKAVSSWTSVHFGLWSVHGIASEQNANMNTCRMAVQATIEPQNIFATYRSMGRAFNTLAWDFDYDKHTERGEDYLGLSEMIRGEIDYYKSLFADQHGGPMRQYEYVVRTTPLRVKNIKVFRRGDDDLHTGHDDPHNHGSYRGWGKPGIDF